VVCADVNLFGKTNTVIKNVAILLVATEGVGLGLNAEKASTIFTQK
jgi:hypothetical protein